MLLKHLVGAALTAVCMVAPIVGQTADPSSSPATITADGTLPGSVRSATYDVVPEAQVSLVLQGKVIDLASSDDSGNFSFPDINPGQYQIVASSEGMVSAKSFNVGPFVDEDSALPANIILRASDPELAYEIVGSAPLTSYSSVGAGSSTGNGSGLGGRLLSSPGRLLLAGGLVGGLAAIDGEVASPDQ